MKFYNQFDIEIVGETYNRGTTFFPTEKTVRPISAQKPFVVYGPQYFLERLKDMGFRTWNNIWDESYDQYQGPTRWQAMFETIKYIVSQDQTIIKMQAAEVATHNRLVLTELIERYRPG